jgi:hypothetical protein
MPAEEKPSFFKSRVEIYHTILVFRRALTPGVEPVVTSYIEDKSDAPKIQPQPEKHLPTEPSVSAGWAGTDDGGFPPDPPLRARRDDSPFAEPEDAPNQVIR